MPGQNRAEYRTRPPPCMRWRGPCLAASHQVSRLPSLPCAAPGGRLPGLPALGQVGRFPGLPGPAGRPPVPCTRGKYRFPGSSHVPGVASEWCPFPTVRYFYCLGGVPRKGLAQSHCEFLSCPHAVHRTQVVNRNY